MRDSEKPMFSIPQGEVCTVSPFGQTAVSDDLRVRNNIADANYIGTPSHEPQLSFSSGDWRSHEGVGTGYGESYGDVTTASPRVDPYNFAYGLRSGSKR